LDDTFGLDGSMKNPRQAFHEAITAVAITDHRDEPLDRTALLGEFIAAMPGEINGVESTWANSLCR
jgi:hypothetical protein